MGRRLSQKGHSVASSRLPLLFLLQSFEGTNEKERSALFSATGHRDFETIEQVQQALPNLRIRSCSCRLGFPSESPVGSQNRSHSMFAQTSGLVFFVSMIFHKSNNMKPIKVPSVRDILGDVMDSVLLMILHGRRNSL
ncbi:uncharacterized protein LOC108951528 isoform X1 [Musa acuminata AAA Group]|uniref:uncharacterized protein LOC108951528 isoform X1 n=1 Tax=Musa acuminata AAA Group TaxID=214697 RepID=UPI0031DFB0A3